MNSDIVENGDMVSCSQPAILFTFSVPTCGDVSVFCCCNKTLETGTLEINTAHLHNSFQELKVLVRVALPVRPLVRAS